MIKTLTKIFAFSAIVKNLVETKKSKTEGITQLHPSKISGRTIYIREKEYFIRESYVEGTTPIVFLHSWGSDSLGSWFKVLPKYETKNSFVAIDLKNHGKSDASWERWDIDENADTVISILNNLNIKKCYLVGWSMGSAVALSITRKNPNLIKKLVLITPFSWQGFSAESPLFKLFVAAVRIRERLFPNSNPQSKYSFLRKSKAVKNEYSEWAWNNLHKSKDNFIYADGGRFVVPFDARPWLDQIETQTLVLTGGKDSLVPEHISSEIIDGLENVESKIFTDATHGIPWTHDHELVEELDRFLKL